MASTASTCLTGRIPRFIPLFALLAATLTLLVAGPAVAQPVDLQGAQDRLAALERDHEAAVVELLLVQERLRAAEEAQSQAEERLETLQAELSESLEQRDRADADLQAVEDRLGAQLEETYKAGRTGWISLIFQSDDFGDLVDRVRMLGRVAEDEAELRDEIVAKRAELATAVSDLERAQSRQQAALTDLSASRSELDAAAARQEKVAGALGDRLSAAQEDVQAARERMEELNRQAQADAPASRGAEASGSSSRSGEAAPSTTKPATKPAPSSEAPSSGAAPSSAPSGGRQIEAKVTAYALRGTTATGVPVRRGIIAVDPRVIPLGTRIFVPGYGEGIAADTGSAVKGNVVDVWLPSRQAALDWGIKRLTITVYD